MVIHRQTRGDKLGRVREVRSVTVKFDPEEIALIERLARALGCNKSDVLRQALQGFARSQKDWTETPASKPRRNTKGK